MKKILFVDDEPEVLSSLRRMLRGKRKEWALSFVESGPKALELLEQEPFDLIVTDMRMPIMDGAKLLKEVRLRYPEMTRIVLSGHSDHGKILNSVNPAHQYLAKPIQRDELINSLNKVLNLKNVLTDPGLVKLLASLDSLPSLPAIHMELMEEVKSEDCSMKKVGEIIAHDMGLTTSLLKLVNSSFFGLPRKVSSPEQAAALLGLEVIQSLVLFEKFFFALEGSDLGVISCDSLWRHAMLVAKMAKEIAETRPETRGAAGKFFMSGMLHDIGKFILLSNARDRYQQALEKAIAESITLYEAENLVFQAGHAEVGAYLLGLWGFDEETVKAVALHHRLLGEGQEKSAMISAVCIANALCNEYAPQIDNLNQGNFPTELVKALGWEKHIDVWRASCAERAKDWKEDENT